MTIIHRAARLLLLHPAYARGPRFAGTLPESMRRQSNVSTLMSETREALDRVEDQVIFGGVIFLNTDQIGTLPSREQAAIHTGPLPGMEYFRWPVSLIARFASRAMRKLCAPFTRRQERFNLDLLETLRRMEDRIESQQHAARQLRQRIMELEERLGSWE
jgi:hypothetical protein